MGSADGPQALARRARVSHLSTVNDLQLAEELFERLSAQNARFHAQAYVFVLAALEYCQERRPARGHIAGDELAWACRDLARDRFGLTARTVLTHWGVETTQDIGRIVYALIDAGLLISQPQDRLEDFLDVFDFAEAFEHGYPWSGVNRNGGRR
jgi:uncharacterized repeat protein (TIGR04138 family)